MKTAIMLLCLLLLCACEPTAIDDNRREVDKDSRKGGPMGTGNMDDALQTEAVLGIGRLRDDLSKAGMLKYGGDMTKAARAISSGPLTNQKLASMGIRSLDGTYYKTTDYKVTLVEGSKVTVTVGQPGTRGYVSKTVTIR